MTETVTIIVSQLGRGQHTTIAEALQAAPPGALIAVEPGIYRENLILDKAVEIVGTERAEDTVIETSDASCLVMQTDRAMVRNLSMRVQPAEPYPPETGHYGVDIPMGQLTLLDCYIISRSWSSIGIHGDAANPIIRRCTLHSSTQAGVLVKEGGHGLIEDCTIAGNAVAVEGRQASRLILRRCIMRENQQHGVFVHADAQAILEDCTISECENGIYIATNASVAMHRCRIHDIRDGGVWVTQANVTLEDCEITRCAEASVRIIGEGGAVTLSRCNMEGYRVGVIACESAVARLERCRLLDDSAVSLVVTTKGVATLIGCTVRAIVSGSVEIHGGDITLEKCDITGVKDASAVSAFGGTTLALRECMIHDSNGHGIYLYTAESTVESCTIYQHKYQGIRLEQGGRVTMRAGAIRQCQLALSLSDKSQALVEDCMLLHNGRSQQDKDGDGDTYAQVWTANESSISLIRCSIQGGARDGVGLRYRSAGTMEDCTIRDNAHDGVWIGEQSMATIRGCYINGHKYNAITIKKDCAVVVEDCDLTGNMRGAWDLPLFGVRGLRRTRNKV